MSFCNAYLSVWNMNYEIHKNLHRLPQVTQQAHQNNNMQT